MEGPVTRTFVAVSMPDEVRMALADRLRALAIPGKVVAAENWHITLRFLGRTEQVAYERLLAALDTSDLGPPFEIELGKLGGFPRAGRATVVWLAVTRGVGHLGELATVAEEAAQIAGFAPEERPYRPHLTVSRVRPAADVRRLVDEFPGADVGWRCGSIVVYRSHTGRGSARYEPLETFALTR